jgi:hypothetical protein
VGAADVGSRTTDHDDADNHDADHHDDDNHDDQPDRDDRDERAHIHAEQPDVAHVDHPGSGHDDVADPGRAGSAVAHAAATISLAATVHSASTATLACRDDHP